MTGPRRRPRVLLADDHLLVAEALRSLLTAEFDLVGVVADGRALVEAAKRLRPDVIVADIAMPHLNGIDALVRLRQDGDRVPVVFLTMHRDVTFARRAIEAGASGFVLKHSASAELITAIRAASRRQDLSHAAARGRGSGRHEAGARARPPTQSVPSRRGSGRCSSSWRRGVRQRRSPRASRSRSGRWSSTSTS